MKTETAIEALFSSRQKNLDAKKQNKTEREREGEREKQTHKTSKAF